MLRYPIARTLRPSPSPHDLRVWERSLLMVSRAAAAGSPAWISATAMKRKARWGIPNSPESSSKVRLSSAEKSSCSRNRCPFFACSLRYIMFSEISCVTSISLTSQGISKSGKQDASASSTSDGGISGM